MASISINWDDLGKVAGVSLAFSVGIVIVFALGVLAISRVEAVKASDGSEGSDSSGSAAAGYTLAGLCFAACAAATAYGIYLIVPQFH